MSSTKITKPVKVGKPVKVAKPASDSEVEADIVIEEKPIIAPKDKKTPVKKESTKKEEPVKKESTKKEEPAKKESSKKTLAKVASDSEADSESEPDAEVEVKTETKVKKPRKPRTKNNNVFKAVGIKRPTLYTVFMKQYFASLPAGAEKSLTAVSKAYAEIKDDVKKMAPYVKEFEALKTAYKNEFENQKQSAIDRGDFTEKVKRPMSAYMLFATSPTIREYAKKKGMSITETAKYCGSKWKEMSEVEKLPYNKLALTAKEKSVVELESSNSKQLKAKKQAVAVPSESENTEAEVSEASATEASEASDSDSSATSKKGKKKSVKAKATITEESDA